MSDQDVDRPTPVVHDYSNEVTQLALVALQRYTGWLGHDFSSKRMRAAVGALRLALDQGGSPDAVAAAMATAISEAERLSAIGLRSLFRKALQDLGGGLNTKGEEAVAIVVTASEDAGSALRQNDPITPMEPTPKLERRVTRDRRAKPGGRRSTDTSHEARERRAKQISEYLATQTPKKPA